jgi:hypothetical protein
MSNRNPAPLSEGTAITWPAVMGHTVTIGAPGAGKTTCDVFRLLAEEYRPIRSSEETPDAGDDACA